MKCFKRLLMIAVVMVIMAVINITATASNIQICYDGATHTYTGSIYKLFVNGNEISSPMEPIIFNNHALVPVREVFEEFGAKVEYDGDTKCVKVKYNNTYITMHINNNCAYINGKPVQIPDNVVPKLIYKPGGLTKTMVPVRFISESVGMDVDFDGEKGEIRITGTETVPQTPPNPTASPTTKPTSAPQEDPITIKTVESKQLSDKKVRVTVTCDTSPEGKVSYFSLKSPERVVVDFKGIDYIGGSKTFTMNSDVIKTVRTGVDSERTRIVIDVENLDEYRVDINGKKVTITVSVTGEKPVATPKPTTKPSTSTTDKNYTQAGNSAANSKYNTGIVKASAKDAKKLIMLDAGHGGTDPGAVGELNGKTVKEKDLTLSITHKVKAVLESNGYKVAMTRKGDTLPSLSERPEMANDKNCALFVSIHINSAEDESAKGTEVFYSEENNEDDYGVTSQELATNILDGMLKYMKSSDRGVRMANWAVIRRANMPAILLEVGFISNEKELKLMCSDDYQNKVAVGIAEGIINTIHYVEVP